MSFKVNVAGAGLCNAGVAAKEIQITSNDRTVYEKADGPVLAFGPSIEGQEKLANIYQYDVLGRPSRKHPFWLQPFTSRTEFTPPADEVPKCGEAVLGTAVFDLSVP